MSLSLMELEMADQLSTVDAAARVSHRQLLVAFGLLLFISIAALLGFGSPSLAATGHAMWMVVPGVITTLVAVLYGMGQRIDKRSIDAVRNDELRQASLQRAWRNGFFMMLVAQPIAAIAFVWISVNHEVAVMAAVTVVTGSLTGLASLLWHDR
jgi:predicted permease